MDSTVKCLHGVILASALIALSSMTAAQPRYAYVPNAADGTVSAIDLRADRVAWTLRVGERAAHGIAASPDGSRVYAADAAAREVVFIDAASRAVAKRVGVPFPVHGIDLSPDGRTLWVGGQADNDPIRGTLGVIDTASGEIRAIVSPTLGAASHFAFTPDGAEVWIASTSTNLVWIVDGRSHRVVAAIPLSLPEREQRAAPRDDWGAFLAERSLIGLNEVAISPDGRHAYAVGPATSQLFMIDIESRSVVQSVAAGERAHGVSVSRDGREVWIADWAGVVSIFDARTLKPLARIPVGRPGEPGPGANHVGFTPDGARAYVTSGNELLALDTRTRSVLARIPVGKEPHEISLEDFVAPAGASGGASHPAAAGPTRTSDARAVSVAVTPLKPSDANEPLQFRVVMETHAVDLDYDLTGIAVLRDSLGNEHRPVRWDGPRGGHHVSGVLSFGEAGAILKPGAGEIELRIAGVAGVPQRVFRWEAGALD